MSRARVTTQQLVDLVLDPRDPGYEAAAERHGGHAPKHWYDDPLVALGALVIGFALAVSWVHTHRGAPQAAEVHDKLVGQVRTAEHTVTDLSNTEASLAATLNRVRAQALAGSSPLLHNLEQDQVVAGLTPVHGPGVEVRLAEPTVTSQPTDPAARPSRGPSVVANILSDRDVRSVVNQLWADGAEAVAVNGIRLTPTSAIRFAGDAVLVDFQPIDSPYVIDAVGDANALLTGFADSDVASRYQTLASARGIGFSFGQKTDLSLSGSASTSLRYARLQR